MLMGASILEIGVKINKMGMGHFTLVRIMLKLKGFGSKGRFCKL